MFTENHESAVKIIAAQTAVAIEKTRLLEAAEQAKQEAEHAKEALARMNATLETTIAERTATLYRTEQQFQQLVMGITDCAIYMTDRNGFIMNWNAGAERIKGYTAGEIVGRHIRTFYTEEDRAGQVPEQEERVPVGPVQVVEHQDESVLLGY